MTEIRQAILKDAATIASLGKITFIESHSDFVQNDAAVETFCNEEFAINKIKDDLASDNQLFWIVFYDDRPVGFAKVITNKSNDFLNTDNVCKLDKIYILNDYIGHKLGSKLHAKIIKKMQGLRFEFIWLVTYIYNYKAIKFYENNQYKKSGFTDFMVDGKGYQNHVMIKKLTI